MKRWHPLNRGVWVAARVTLAGHLLQAKGDRVSTLPYLDSCLLERGRKEIIEEEMA